MSRRAKFRKHFFYFGFWTILIVSFLFFAFLIVLKANGYQLNWRYWRIQKTGMIILNGEPRDVEIKINQKYLQGLPLRLANQTPDTYEISVSREDYHTWQKVYEVLPGKAISSTNILLFLSEARENNSTKGLTAQKVLEEYQNITRDLEIREKELYWQNKLITRFGSPILAAGLYPDNQHFICQVNSEIRVLDLDGSNNFLLFGLNSYEPTIFTFKDNGRTIIYLDDGQIQAKTIR